MVAAGSIVRCQVSSTTMFFSSPDDVVNAASSILAQSGYGIRNASAQTAGILDQILGIGSNFPFQASLDVQVPAAFGDPNDVLSIVSNAFYQVTGSYPTAAAVVSVAGADGSTQTVSPGLDPAGIGGSGSGVTSAISGELAGAGSAILGAGSNLLIGAVVLVVAVLLIVGYAPNTGKVTGAFA